MIVRWLFFAIAWIQFSFHVSLISSYSLHRSTHCGCLRIPCFPLIAYACVVEKLLSRSNWSLSWMFQTLIVDARTSDRIETGIPIRTMRRFRYSADDMIVIHSRCNSHSGMLSCQMKIFVRIALGEIEIELIKRVFQSKLFQHEIWSLNAFHIQNRSFSPQAY